MPQDEQTKAAEYLRLALPLMSKYKIPVTPRNYAVWYEYVAGTNPALKEKLDGVISEGAGRSPSGPVLDGIFLEYVAGYEVRLADQAREALRELLSGASTSFADANSDFVHFEDVLCAIADRLSLETSAEDLSGFVAELSEETKAVQAHGTRLVSRLNDSQREVELLREQLEQARKQATTDALTGLSNRTVFDERICELIRDHETRDLEFGLVMMDIDKFKLVNDTHGHLVGDKVIRFVAKTMVESVKGRDLVARYGGEEFALLLPQTGLNGCMTVGETIRQAVEKSRLVKSGTREPLGTITVSGGIAVYRKGESVEAFIQRADDALYASKQNGRNQLTGESEPSGPELASAV